MKSSTSLSILVAALSCTLGAALPVPTTTYAVHMPAMPAWVLQPVVTPLLIPLNPGTPLHEGDLLIEARATETTDQERIDSLSTAISPITDSTSSTDSTSQSTAPRLDGDGVPSFAPISADQAGARFPRDARAATIFKADNLRGESTFIPANMWCTDIRNIFGGFDGQVRSLSVEKGHVCRFYQEEGCLVSDFTGGGAVLEVGFRRKKDDRRWLGSWEGKVASVLCQRLV